MITLSISNLNEHLANKNYRVIVKNRELLWQLFCSIDEPRLPYFDVHFIDSNTLHIYGDCDAICHFKRFIVQIQDIFIRALKNERQSAFKTVTLNDDIYFSSDKSNLIECERFHLPHVMDCIFPRFLEMAKELNIKIDRKIQYALILNGNHLIECETEKYTVTLSEQFKKSGLAYSFYALYVKQEMCDLTIILPQGQIRAHRAILALNAGPFFRAELINQDTLTINFVSLYTFKAFLTYVYLGTKSYEILSADKILDFKELYKFADFSKLEDLSTFCLNELGKRSLRLS